MSLKAFHILFITLAILLSLGCAVWSFSNQVMPGFGWASAVTAVALVAYEIYFVRKSKRIIT
jgi:hypothetical protein